MIDRRPIDLGVGGSPLLLTCVHKSAAAEKNAWKSGSAAGDELKQQLTF